MQSSHRVYNRNASDLSPLDTNSVDLVVTSPPYPMIEMWDDLFANANSDIGEALDSGNGHRAFDLMHNELADVWDELKRVLCPGGIAAINIGDATRTIGGHFEVYPNHRRISQEFTARDFHRLPLITWHKPTNSKAKFMGSGMIPPNAYPTLEHEYILLFRNGTRRTDFAEDNIRYESAYFWEERNNWFTDRWTDVNGCEQSLENIPSRDRSAAYPIDIPQRIIKMFSVYGDTVLDPFWGTGTTTIAAILTARNSIGIEINSELVDSFTGQPPTDFPTLAQEYNELRLEKHADFLQNYSGTPKYTLTGTDIPVITQQEQDMEFYTVDDVDVLDNGYDITHRKLSRDTIESLCSNLE